MAKIFVTSDTHFNHTNILGFVNSNGEQVRPGFKDVNEMNERLISNWNSVVSPQDHVYHLGDVYFGKGKDSSNIRNILSRLHGKKRLCLGNHDDGMDPILHEFFDKIMLWRMFTDIGVLLSHTAQHDSVLWDPKKLSVNIHGHIHRNPQVSPKHFNASCEMTDYFPVEINELVSRWKKENTK